MLWSRASHRRGSSQQDVEGQEDSSPTTASERAMTALNWLAHPQKTYRKKQLRQIYISPNPPDQTPSPYKLRLQHENFSRIAIDRKATQDSLFFQKLPLELRREVYAYAIGRERLRLITIPWRLHVMLHLDPTTEYATGEDKSKYHLRLMGRPHPPSLQLQRTALLKTCRQVYIEAVDLLYSSNTFRLHDLPTLPSFAASIPPQRLAHVRSVEFYWSARTTEPYPHPTWRVRRLRSRTADFTDFVDVLAGMQGLQHLSLHVENPRRHTHPHRDVWADVGFLWSLIGISGLRTFNVTLIRFCNVHRMRWDACDEEDFLESLKGWIEKAVRLPRE